MRNFIENIKRFSETIWYTITGKCRVLICIKNKQIQLVSIDLDSEQVIEVLKKTLNEMEFKTSVDKEINDITK